MNTAYTEIDIEEIKDWLKNNLSQKRYNHSVGTAEYAKNLAVKFGLNPDKAYIAGLLHDCAKCFEEEKMLEIMDKCPNILEDEKQNYKTWHAPVSYYVAKNTFKIKDEEILSSIRWHTIGKINMSAFEKIIFLSDKVELATRKDEYATPIRNVIETEKNLDKAMLICYKQTIKSLIDRNFKITNVTVSIYNHLQDIVNVN